MEKFRDHVYKTYLAENRPFYHITPNGNLPEILANGLERRNIIGICCVLIPDEVIVRHILDTQLKTTDANHFTIIKIEPEKFGLTINELARDQTTELTNILHINIIRDRLLVSKSDVYSEIEADDTKIPDQETVINRAKELRYQINVSVL